MLKNTNKLSTKAMDNMAGIKKLSTISLNSIFVSQIQKKTMFPNPYKIATLKKNTCLNMPANKVGHMLLFFMLVNIINESQRFISMTLGVKTA